MDLSASAVRIRDVGPRRALVLGAPVLSLGAILVVAGSTPWEEKRSAPGTASPQAGASHAAAPTALTRVAVERSAEGRPIRAIAPSERIRDPRLLVVGCIHGDECAGMAVARRLVALRLPSGTGIAVVPNLNPDGYVLETRLNARGVDLNRNFPSEWRPIGRAGDPQHSGPRPFSEPETRIARSLIRRFQPEITIWFHQQAEPLVRAWGQSITAARRYARLTGLAFHDLPWLAGTAPNWQNHRFPGTSSFVVELAPGSLSGKEVRRHVRTVVRMGR